MGDKKLMQRRFRDFLFHRSNGVSNTELAREKKMLYTGFAQRKCRLWKTGGLRFYKQKM